MVLRIVFCAIDLNICCNQHCHQLWYQLKFFQHVPIIPIHNVGQKVPLFNQSFVLWSVFGGGRIIPSDSELNKASAESNGTVDTPLIIQIGEG